MLLSEIVIMLTNYQVCIWSLLTVSKVKILRIILYWIVTSLIQTSSTVSIA